MPSQKERNNMHKDFSDGVLWSSKILREKIRISDDTLEHVILYSLRKKKISLF